MLDTQKHLQVETYEQSNAPVVVISLDFELRWGMHDRLGLNRDALRSCLENDRERVIPTLLHMLAERNIHATWATVGAVGCQDWQDYFARAPRAPRYHEPSLCVKPEYAEMDPGGYLHFAPELVRRIHETSGQELGTHTFSHIYMREPGVTVADVRADLQAARDLWVETVGYAPASLVFPRNQCAFIQVIEAMGINIWRGTEKYWFYDANDRRSNTRLPRALRLLDSFNPYGRRACPLEGNMTRASRFLRLNLPDSLWRMQVKCITAELAGVKNGEIYHLWWHPHNAGEDVDVRLTRIKEVLDVIAGFLEKRRFISLTMGELAHEMAICRVATS